jgi:acetate kinase
MLLVVNAGSSSLKLAVFDGELALVTGARLEEIGSTGPATHLEAFGAGLAAMGVPFADMALCMVGRP